MVNLLILLITFAAVFTQSVSGFGLALISMPLLTLLVGIQTAAPLVALLAIFLEIILVLYYRNDLDIRAVIPLAISSTVGVPIGVIALKRVDEKITLTILGLVLIGYALYRLLDLVLPTLQRERWSYAFGFVAGILGGAYNTSGPPVIIYGDLRRWKPVEFRGNLQGFFLVNSGTIIIGHVWNGNLTPTIWNHFLVMIPAIVIGLLLGIALSKRINPITFRRIVLTLLILLGLNLIFL
jgi:uncharacterized membrane protein YfcA